eukprot:2525820-Pleurochrysis_carterae.AAC.1
MRRLQRARAAHARPRRLLAHCARCVGGAGAPHARTPAAWPRRYCPEARAARLPTFRPPSGHQRSGGTMFRVRGATSPPAAPAPTRPSSIRRPPAKRRASSRPSLRLTLSPPSLKRCQALNNASSPPTPATAGRRLRAGMNIYCI